ncbi:MAG: hypothetical protein K2H69_01515 [Alistipes sp.]|nr:hypothetical protein [Alistipes sp.]
MAARMLPARIVSGLLHPLLLPLYSAAALLCGRTGYAALYPLRIKLYLAWSVALFTVLVPALSLALLRSSRRIADLELSRRSDRIVPLALMVFCYTLCALAVVRVPGAHALSRFVFCGAGCAACCLAVSCFWKISLHLTGMGAVSAILFWIGAAGGDTVLLLALALTGAGALAAARLRLGRHTPAQVAVGFAGGAAVSSCIVLWV